MKHIKSITSIFFLSALVACGGTVPPTTTTTTSTATKYEFGTPTSFSVTSKDSGALVSYAYNGAATGGYDIYFGTTSDLTGLGDGFITSPYHTTANSVNFSDLTNGTTYYFAVVAQTSSGTSSPRTTTATVVPAHVAGSVAKIAVATMEICFSKLDKIRFADGKLYLSEHQGGTSYPGQNGDCNSGMKGMRIHTTQDNGTYNRVIPVSGVWSPTEVGQSLDLALPNYVVGTDITITDLSPYQLGCKSGKTDVHSDVDDSSVANTIVFDGNDCKDDALNFINGDKGTIAFKINYTADE